MDSGTYVCSAYYDNEYSSNSSILIKRADDFNKIETNNYLTTKKVKPIIELTPLIEDNFLYGSIVQIDCSSLFAKSQDSESIEWIRLEDEMSERTSVTRNSLIINRFEINFNNKLFYLL